MPSWAASRLNLVATGVSAVSAATSAVPGAHEVAHSLYTHARGLMYREARHQARAAGHQALVHGERLVRDVYGKVVGKLRASAGKRPALEQAVEKVVQQARKHMRLKPPSGGGGGSSGVGYLKRMAREVMSAAPRARASKLRGAKASRYPPRRSAAAAISRVRCTRRRGCRCYRH